MKKYTPKQLANELKIENKQEMRNMLRDYKKVLNPTPLNHSYYRCTKEEQEISCGPYMTYGDTDLLKLRQIQMFKQLGVKKSKIISLMERENTSLVIDVLIEMLENKQKEIQDQLIMAKGLKGAGGMRSEIAEVLLLGKTPHQYAEELKEELKDEYSMKVELYFLGRILSLDEILKHLTDLDCIGIQGVKEFLASTEFTDKVMKQVKFDEDFTEKLNKFFKVLAQYETHNESVEKRIHAKIKSFIRYMNRRYDFSGLVEFGMLWILNEGILTNLKYSEEDRDRIEDAMIFCFDYEDLSRQEQIAAKLMFELDDWISDLFYNCMIDAYECVGNNDWEKACDLIHGFIEENTAIKNRDEMVFFEYFIKSKCSNVMKLLYQSEMGGDESSEDAEAVLAKYHEILQKVFNDEFGYANE